MNSLFIDFVKVKVVGWLVIDLFLIVNGKCCLEVEDSDVLYVFFKCNSINVVGEVNFLGFYLF